MSEWKPVNSRFTGFTGIMAWQLEQGKIPGENGGGGTSSCSECVPAAARGYRDSDAVISSSCPAPHAASMVRGANPSAKIPNPNRLSWRHLNIEASTGDHMLHFADPHGLKNLEPLSDDPGQIRVHRKTKVGVFRECRQEGGPGQR